MTDFEARLEEAWATLSRDRAGRGVDTSEVDLQLPSGRVRVGIDGWGARHLLIPVGDGEVSDDRRSRGVLLVRQDLQSGSSGTVTYADLVCASPELQDVFTALAADVCASVSEAPDTPGEVAAGVLERWRQLLSRGRADATFTESAAIGLMGELIVLKRAVEAAGPSALEAWTGPDRLHHDFRRGDVAVEVKTTTAREGLRVEIHGLEQLDHSADVRLHLAVLRLISDPAGSTLPQLVDELADMVDRVALIEALRTWGYTHRQTPPPDGASTWPRHLPTDLLIWEVGPTFPAIRRANLPESAPAALESLRYVVNLAGAGQPLEDEKAQAVLARLQGTH